MQGKNSVLYEGDCMQHIHEVAEWSLSLSHLQAKSLTKVVEDPTDSGKEKWCNLCFSTLEALGPPELTFCTASRMLGGMAESVIVLPAGMLSTSRMDCCVLCVAVAVSARTALQGTFSFISIPNRKYADLHEHLLLCSVMRQCSCPQFDERLQQEISNIVAASLHPISGCHSASSSTLGFKMSTIRHAKISWSDRQMKDCLKLCPHSATQ